ncbi:MAG: permease [Acidobacteriota bacterium]|nr:permease [Acidobacteriota bacterium]
MTATIAQVGVWIGRGLRESAAMVWMTFWPLVLGFSLSGAVQSFLPRDGLRARLGRTSAATVGRASVLGMISSSCSYAASAMARALFARGASWPNALVFMVASTNLVIELGLVLYLLLGWPFVLAQLVGGAIMIAALGLLAGLVFPAAAQEDLRARVLGDAPPAQAATRTWRERLHTRDSYRAAARFAWGDLTMLRRELLAGFVVAGFLTVHVPSAWWSHLFWTGHGAATAVENAVLAPLLAVISFVCSVGNIPLAAALWVHGVAFGGVVSFIFADLVTLPLLLIYRRFYGTRATLRLFALLWVVMSGGGLLVDAIFSAAHAVPATRHSAALRGDFPLGATLALNVAAAALLGLVWWASRRRAGGATARDPICGMEVDVSAPAAVRQREGVTYYFCSPRCADRFDAAPVAATAEALDPVCQMTVDPATALSWTDPAGHAHYFCGPGCRETYAAGHGAREALDPVCQMTVDPATALSWTDPAGVAHYFCGPGCRESYSNAHGAGTETHEPGHV